MLKGNEVNSLDWVKSHVGRVRLNFLNGLFHEIEAFHAVVSTILFSDVFILHEVRNIIFLYKVVRIFSCVYIS